MNAVAWRRDQVFGRSSPAAGSRFEHALPSQTAGLSVRGDFWALPVEILVFTSPTGYMFTSSGFPLH